LRRQDWRSAIGIFGGRLSFDVAVALGLEPLSFLLLLPALFVLLSLALDRLFVRAGFGLVLTL